MGSPFGEHLVHELNADRSLADSRGHTVVAASVAPNLARRRTKRANEGPTHALAISKTRLPRNDIKRVMTILQHDLRGSRRSTSTALAGDVFAHSKTGSAAKLIA